MTAILKGFSSSGTPVKLDYRGGWNASTNSPTLVSSTGTIGQAYVVTTTGTTTLDSVTSWAAGDTVYFNGSVWQKIASPSSLSDREVVDFTWRPSATITSDRVFSNFADLTAAIAEVNAEKYIRVFIDDSLASATVPAGSQVFNNIHWIGMGRNARTLAVDLFGTDYSSDTRTVVNFSNATTFTNVALPAFFNCVFENLVIKHSSASSVFVTGGTNVGLFKLINTSIGSTTAPFFDVTTTAGFLLNMDQTSVLWGVDNGSYVMEIGAQDIDINMVGNSLIGQDAIQGTGSISIRNMAVGCTVYDQPNLTTLNLPVSPIGGAHLISQWHHLFDITPNTTQTAYFAVPSGQYYYLDEVQVTSLGGAVASAGGDVTLSVTEISGGATELLSAATVVLDGISATTPTPQSLTSTAGNRVLTAGQLIEVTVVFPSDTTPASGGQLLVDLNYRMGYWQT